MYVKTQSGQVEGDIAGTAYPVLPFDEIQNFNGGFGGLPADLTDPVGVQDQIPGYQDAKRAPKR